MVESQTLYTKLSKETLKKVGEWDSIRQLPKIGLQPNWNELSDSEKTSYLSYHHELMHFIDITSLPAGAFYWRLWYSLNYYCDKIFQFLKELDLLSEITFPVVDWMNSRKGTVSIYQRLSMRSEIFGLHYDQEDIGDIVYDYTKRFPGVISRFENIAIELLHDPCPESKIYTKDLTYLSNKMKELFSLDRVFEYSEYEKLPNAHWRGKRERPEYSKGNLLSFSEIFEFRAYIRESKLINDHNDARFLEIWLDRLKERLSSNLFEKIKIYSNPKIPHQIPIYITDIALSGSIDINCNFYYKSGAKKCLIDFSLLSR